MKTFALLLPLLLLAGCVVAPLEAGPPVYAAPAVVVSPHPPGRYHRHHRRHHRHRHWH